MYKKGSAVKTIVAIGAVENKGACEKEWMGWHLVWYTTAAAYHPLNNRAPFHGRQTRLC